jgi:hypothetical protein
MAYQAYEVSNGKPAKQVDDLALGKEDVKEFKRWLNLDGLGVSLADSRKEDLAKMVMVYEKEARKDGGMVMLYDGSVKTLSADDLKKLLGGDGKGPPSKAKVYVYPNKLTAKDKLSFCPGKDQKETIPIKGDTTLIYVDLAPDARFAHRTQCILVSTEGARVIKGEWWPILNGEDLFRDGKGYEVEFPIDLSGR